MVSRYRLLVVALASLSLGNLAGCQTATGSPESGQQSGQASLTTTCQAPRPEICTREYRPVCGYRDDGSWHTYGNACTACADTQVVGHNPGECDADSKE